MLKRMFLCLALLLAATRAAAVDYTDIYYVLGEDGYGFNVVENDNANGSFLFVTFFIYGQNKQPTWYTAQLTLGEKGTFFTGGLYATTGSYYGSPWNPSDHPPAVQVGTASFQPTSPYTANFSFTVFGPPTVTVTKTIQRQFLGNFLIDGTYLGAAVSVYSGCATPPGSIVDAVAITITHQTSTSASIALNYAASGVVCTFTGNLIASGKLYQVPTASYACSNGFSTTAKIDQLSKTPHGIEGLWTDITHGGCREAGLFSGLGGQ